MTFLPLVHDEESGAFGVRLPDPPEPERVEVIAGGESERVTELRVALSRAASRWPLPIPVGAPDSEGHGHVRPRDDGRLQRCGGPNRCGQCEREQHALRSGELPTEFDAVLNRAQGL